MPIMVMAVNSMIKAIRILTFSFKEFRCLKMFEAVKLMDFDDWWAGVVGLEVAFAVEKALNELEKKRCTLSNARSAFDLGLPSDGFRFGGFIYFQSASSSVR